MKLEVGKKYTDGRDVLEIKFIDWEGTGWGLTDERKSCRYIKTYDTAWTEVTDKPNPGEGWRLLHPDEDVEESDEYYSPANNAWSKSAKFRYGGKQGNFTYRRRTTPQYVPYTWDDREELRGRWCRLKDHTGDYFVGELSIDYEGDFMINGVYASEFLESYEWLDGSPCGKKVV